jgi:hypothetical protein
MNRTQTRGLAARTIAALVSVAVVAGPAATFAQEAITDDAVGLGGRVEISNAGYALTLPQDWLYIRPTRADLDVILDEVDAVMPELGPAVGAALAGGLGVSLIAFGGHSEGLPESCNILDRAAAGRSVDAIALEEMAKLGALGDIIASGPDLTFVELPAGRAARIDVGLRLPEIDADSTTYILVDENWIHTMTCTDDVRPDDAWESIVGTFELVPPTD